MMHSQNKKWLIIIAVILVSIFAVMLIEVNKKTEMEKMGDSITGVVSSIGNEATKFRKEVID